MAIIANTFETYGAKGIREDLTNMIYNISPKDTPFMSNGKRGKASNTFHEWQTDVLAAASSANQQLEGDDLASFTAVTATVRMGTHMMISRKDVIIAGTLEAVDKAGRKSELAYQLAKKSAELKRDMEASLLANQGFNAGAAGTARVSAGLPTWIKTNTVLGAGGANVSYTSEPAAARTDGTQVAISEANLKTVVQLAWTNGGDPRILMVGPTEKQTVSTFAGIATKTYYQSAPEPSAIIGTADIYVHDFGKLSVIANRFQRSRDAFVLDPDYYSIVYLRPFQQIALAKTGDAEKRIIIVEYGLAVDTEQAHGAVFDVS